MLSTFEDIINTNYNKITQTDYELAIYYHILNNKLNEAKKITSKALIKYPKYAIFNGYM
jgi:hypothetical protein